MPHTLQPLDPQRATEAEIMALARALVGCTIGEIPGVVGSKESPRVTDKGAVGQLVERAFGIARNNEQAPDFSGAAIELKVVPILRGKRKVRAKERTVITMIDYFRLSEEHWENASVREKIKKILFVFYVHEAEVEAARMTIAAVVLWAPDSEVLPQLKHDWTAVHAKVRAGNAHLISEGDGRLLGACTKGAKTIWVSQPHNAKHKAKKRAWALKQSLTTWLFEAECAGSRLNVTSVYDTLRIPKLQDFESRVLQELRRFRGLTLADIARELKTTLDGGKSAAAVLVRQAIGVSDNRARIREFEERGIRVKTIPLSPKGVAYEAMSFPRFDHMRVADETWEDSELLSNLQRLLIVPLVRDKRASSKDTQVWGTPFFWTPTPSEFDGIRKEWEDYVARIARGDAERLPPASATKYIHVRPHGRDSSDTEEAPSVGHVPKKCFWLNSEYTAKIVMENNGLMGAV